MIELNLDRVPPSKRRKTEEPEPDQIFPILRNALKKFVESRREISGLNCRLLQKPRILMAYDKGALLVSCGLSFGHMTLQYGLKRDRKLVLKNIMAGEEVDCLYDLPPLVRRVSETVRTILETALTLKQGVLITSTKVLQKLLNKKPIGTVLKVSYLGTVDSYETHPYFKDERVWLQQTSGKAVVAEVKKVGRKCISFNVGKKADRKLAYHQLLNRVLFRNSFMEEKEDEGEESVSLAYCTMQLDQSKLNLKDEELLEFWESTDRPQSEPFKLW